MEYYGTFGFVAHSKKRKNRYAFEFFLGIAGAAAVIILRFALY